MMHAIVVGSSGAIAMNLTVCQKQVEKQRRQKVVMIKVHKFRYKKRIDLIVINYSDLIVIISLIKQHYEEAKT